MLTRQWYWKRYVLYVIGYALKVAGEKSSYIIYCWKEKIDNRGLWTVTVQRQDSWQHKLLICCSDGDDGAGEAEAAFHGGAGETARATREETPGAREQKEQEEGGTKVNQLQHVFISAQCKHVSFVPGYSRNLFWQSSQFQNWFYTHCGPRICARLICCSPEQILLYMELWPIHSNDVVHFVQCWHHV